MKTRSLVQRATFSVLGIELLCALCFAGTAIWHERRVQFRALDVSLQGRSDSLIGAVQDSEDPEDRVKIDPEEFSPPGSDVYAVYSADNRLVGSSSAAPSAVIAQGRDGIRTVNAGGHYYRVLQRPALRIIDREENSGIGLRRPVTVIYAIRTDHVWHEVMEAARFNVLLSLALLLVTAIALVFLLRRLLNPLKELAAGASSISAASLQFSPPASALQVRELRPLAEALRRAPQGKLIVDHHYYTFSSVFFYTNRDALLLNGRFNNLVYGSYAPGAPNVFLDDSQWKSMWLQQDRCYLVITAEGVQRLRNLVEPDLLIMVSQSGGKLLLTNHPVVE